MVGRNRKFEGHSEWMNEFNKIHNPDYYYGKEKKKTQSKKKTSIPSQPDEIPYSKYRIEWMDILSDSGWATDKEFHRMKLAFPVNEGWLFSKDRYTIKMFASYDKDVDTNEMTFGDRTMIPVSCIKKMTRIK